MQNYKKMPVEHVQEADADKICSLLQFVLSNCHTMYAGIFFDNKGNRKE